MDRSVLLPVIVLVLSVTIPQIAVSQPGSAPNVAGADPLYDVRVDLDHGAEVAEREVDDARLVRAAAEAGLRFEKTSAPSRTDGLDIPLYIFEPMEPSDVRRALVWVYGGIHDRFGTNYFPFIREAVLEHGTLVVVPEYRGARGYGPAFYGAMDYGGLEVDDALTAADVAAKRAGERVPVGVIGWSHGGLIALLAASRDTERFDAVVASVPVADLVKRMAYKGPEYHRLFIELPTIGGPVHERLQTYLDRSPIHQIDRLTARVMVQVATNDDDVHFIEAEPLVHTLRQKLGERAEVLVFDDPPHGHYFNRQVDLETLTRRDTPAQAESWAAIWRFLHQSL